MRLILSLSAALVTGIGAWIVPDWEAGALLLLASTGCMYLIVDELTKEAACPTVDSSEH